MSKKIFIFLAIILSILIILVGIRIFNNKENKQNIDSSKEITNEGMVGLDRDEHGCIGSAGYTWCQVKEKCLRVWEEGCSIEDELKNYLKDNLSTLSPEPEVLGGKFYVTNLELTSPSTAVVEYEDGHIALKANFVFSYDAEDKLQISNFVLVEE